MNTDYGDWFYIVKVSGSISTDGDIAVFADGVALSADGSLVFQNHSSDKTKKYAGLIIPAGSWKVVYSASMIDGSPVIADRWAMLPKDE